MLNRYYKGTLSRARILTADCRQLRTDKESSGVNREWKMNGVSVGSCVSLGKQHEVQAKQMLTCSSGIWIETTKAPFSFKYSTADGKRMQLY